MNCDIETYSAQHGTRTVRIVFCTSTLLLFSERYFFSESRVYVEVVWFSFLFLNEVAK